MKILAAVLLFLSASCSPNAYNAQGLLEMGLYLIVADYDQNEYVDHMESQLQRLRKWCRKGEERMCLREKMVSKEFDIFKKTGVRGDGFGTSNHLLTELTKE